MNDDRAFSGTGIDYLGPLLKRRRVSTGKDIYERNTLDDCDLFKCNVVLYTCAYNRGVILELVPDARSKYFVYSLRKFISRRGCPRKILTDNGTVFTSQETQNLQQIEIWNDNSVYLTHHGTVVFGGDLFLLLNVV